MPFLPEDQDPRFSLPVEDGFVDVTPEYAQWILDNCSEGEDHRPVTAPTVKKYAAKMKAGEWSNDTRWNPISFNEFGQRANGGHRLASVVEADMTVRLYFVMGVPAADFLVMDTGKTRKASQFVTGQAAEIRVLAARIIYRVLKDLKYTDATQDSAPLDILRAEKWSAISFYQSSVNTAWKACRIYRPTLLAVLAQASLTQHADKIDDFLEGITDPEEGKTSDPRFVLRNQYKRFYEVTKTDKTAGATRHHWRELNAAKNPRSYDIQVQAWNAFVLGNPAHQEFTYNPAKGLHTVVSFDPTIHKF